MLVKSLLKSGGLSCVLPLADVSFGGTSNVETGDPHRLLATPISPVLFYTRETLVSIGLLGTDPDSGGLVASPLPPTGDQKTLPRRRRVAMVTDPNAATPEGRALYAAAYAANGLTAKGVLLYAGGIGTVNFTNPLASLTAITSATTTDRTITVGASSFAATDPAFDDFDISKVDGGEVYVAFTGNGPYTFGVSGVASSSFDLTGGYVTEWAQFKPGSGAFDSVSITGYADYGHVDFPATGGHVRRQFFIATAKAAADLPLALRMVARCEKFQYTFWTPDPDPSGDPIAGDPDGVCAALGIDSVATRKTRDPDTATYIDAICADIAAFFT